MKTIIVLGKKVKVSEHIYARITKFASERKLPIEQAVFLLFQKVI